ncbi:hypothetical protein M758_UG103800 [Ceratodon purpureus]|nr:hypothetical protein M758_UG103800 [Ceratodon purpureus]
MWLRISTCTATRFCFSCNCGLRFKVQRITELAENLQSADSGADRGNTFLLRCDNRLESGFHRRSLHPAAMKSMGRS